MPTDSLSDSKCKSAKPKDKGYKLFDGSGLFLYVTPAGGKIWRLAYRTAGKAQTAVIGPYPLVTLASARAKRDEMRLALLNGESLAHPKKKATITLEDACDTYWLGRKDISPSYRANAENAMIQHILPTLGKRLISDLTRADVLNVLLAMDAAGLHVYVRRARMWLSQVFDWAVEREHCAVNLCALIDPKKAFSKARAESFAALGIAEVKPFMARLDLEGVIQSAVACRLLALTWVRTQELRMMEWSEIEGDVWRIPAGKMKRRREHLVPLSDQALALIENMQARSKGGRFVFPNDRTIEKPMSENSILYLIGRMGFGGKMTGHGWRSVASTWANEAGYNKDAVERQLAHSPDDKVRAAYNKAEFMPARRKMLQDWANWLIPLDRPESVSP